MWSASTTFIHKDRLGFQTIAPLQEYHIDSESINGGYRTGIRASPSSPTSRSPIASQLVVLPLPLPSSGSDEGSRPETLTDSSSPQALPDPLSSSRLPSERAAVLQPEYLHPITNCVHWNRVVLTDTHASKTLPAPWIYQSFPCQEALRMSKYSPICTI